jgi:hypothetical protein
MLPTRSSHVIDISALTAHQFTGFYFRAMLAELIMK